MLLGWLASPSNFTCWFQQFLHSASKSCGWTLKVTWPNPMQQTTPPKQPCQSASACTSLVMGGFLPHSMARGLMHHKRPLTPVRTLPPLLALLIWALLSGIQASLADGVVRDPVPDVSLLTPQFLLGPNPKAPHADMTQHVVAELSEWGSHPDLEGLKGSEGNQKGPLRVGQQPHLSRAADLTVALAEPLLSVRAQASCLV